MALVQADIDYFNRGKVENPRYWSRLGGRPDFKDVTVIDLGCGHGSLCVDIALSGAQRVIGLDLNEQLIGFAKEYLQRHYPQLVDVVEFRAQDVREAPEFGVDYFVSKDTFEHVIGLDQVLEGMKQRLKPGGRLYTGFGPLWNSPFGDHGRMKVNIPWGHTMLPERYLIDRLNRLQTNKVKSVYDLGLNKLSLAEYLRLFRESGMAIVFLMVNASTRPISRVFSLIRRIRLLEEYFSHNIYCIMEKGDVHAGVSRYSLKATVLLQTIQAVIATDLSFLVGQCAV